MEKRTLTVGFEQANQGLREIAEYSKTMDVVAQKLGLFFDLCHQPVVLAEVDHSIADATGYIVTRYQLHDCLMGLLAAVRARNVDGYDIQEFFAHKNSTMSSNAEAQLAPKARQRRRRSTAAPR